MTIRIVLSALLLLPALAAQAQIELVPGVHLLRGTFTPGTQPDGNTIILDAPDGLVVVDTGRHATHTQAILDYAKSSGRPIAAVVNTHWHLDHIGGNAAVRAAYPAVRVYASGALQEALTGFLARYRSQLQELSQTAKSDEQKKVFETEVRLIDQGAKLAPDVVITSSGQRSIAGRTFTVGLETHSVTAGDVWLFDPGRGILIAGDLVTLPAPFLDTACPRRWKSSLDRLAALDFHLLIPGHGAALTKKQFDVYRSAFASLLSCTGKKEPCINAWITTIAPLTTDDEKFTRSLMDYYVDVLRADPAKLQALCGE